MTGPNQPTNVQWLYRVSLQAQKKQNFKHTTTQEFKGRLAFGFE